MFANRLARLKIGQKLGVAVGVSIIPVIVLTTLLVRAENKDIQFGRAEISGVAYLRAVRGVLAPILDHRRHADEWLAGNLDAADALARDESALESALALLSETQARLGTALNTGEQHRSVVDAWTQLKKSNRASTTRDQNIEAHQALVAAVIALMSRVGDTSNLVLDPDLDSYYLMDTVVAKLPALVAASTYTGDFGLVAAARKTRSQDDLIAFVKTIKDVESLSSGVQNNLKAAYENNPALQPKLSPAQDAVDSAAGAFTDQAEWNFVRSTDGRVMVDKFRDAANDIRASALVLWDASAERLVELLEKRVHRFTSQLWWTLTSVGGVVAGALGFIAYIVVGITRGIKRASQVSERIAHGSLDDDIVSHSGDETGALLMSLRDMRNSLRDAQRRDREQAENARRHSAEIQKHADEMKRQADEIQRRATETQRVKVALDSAQANVIIADANFNIVYINKAATAMFSDAEADLRQELPNFAAARLMGQSIDVFHRDPSHQRRLLSGLNGTHKARIVAGKRTFEIAVAPVLDELGARLGSVVEWVDRTVELRVAAEEQRRSAAERKLANENLRIRVALDQVSTNVMLADQDNRIIYMNNAIRDMLREAQADLRKHLSHFNVEKLDGALIDQFHKNPAHQRQLLANLRGTYRAEITAGGRTFALVANSVSNDRGERLGSVVEWRDRTQEVAIEREVNDIVTSASTGDLTRDIRLDGKHGFMKTISEGVNRLIGVCNGVLTDTQRVLAALAGGDLTETIERDYQGEFKKLKDDANATVAKLTEVIGMVKRSSEAIRAASTEIMQGNKDLSQRTEEQASSLEETASSMEEMTGTVKKNADNARQANQLAVEARTLAEHGGDVVGRAVTAMEGISQSSKRIADIIGVIDGIAFQTNLLALNAAVEAARAGEQGRGFAVVATEVRNLAQRSAAAAREIKALIKDSVEKVEEGSKLVNDSGKTLTEIVGAVKKVSDIIAEIAAASHEQSTGIEQVNKAIMQMDEATQQNAALVEQASAASEAMNEQAGALNEQMKFFTVERSTLRVDRRGEGRPWSDRHGAPVVTIDRAPSRR